MFKPGCGDAPVTYLIARQLLQHFHFRPGMAQHIHEIVHDHIEIIVQQVMNIVHQLEPRLVIDHLCIGNFQVAFAQSLQLRAEKFFFMKILSAFFIIILPLNGKLLFNIHRQHACKDGIAAYCVAVGRML